MGGFLRPVRQPIPRAVEKLVPTPQSTINHINLGPRPGNACFYIDFKEMCVFRID